MPIATAILRIFTALILSIPLFFSFSYYLLATAAEDTLLDADFITSSFQKRQLYNRVYRDILLRPEFSEWTSSLVGGFQVSADTKAQLLRSVVPPSYVEAETEENVSEILEYLRGDGNELNAFINLNIPLENIKPTARAFLNQQISNLDSMPVSHPELLSNEIASFLATVAHGQIPAQAPTAQTIDPAQQIQAYEQAIDALARNGSISPGAIANLKQQEPEIIAALQGSDLRTALKIASRSVAEPRIDEAITSISQNSDDQNRLDLAEGVAENSNRTYAQVLKDARILQYLVQALTGEIAQWSALGFTVLCALAMAVVFIPYWKHVIFWPSVIFFIFGLLLLLMAFSNTLDLSPWLSAICQGPDNESCQLTLDISRTIAADITSSFVDTSLKILLLSAIGILVSLVISRISERKSP
jgi:hypothetical protein